MFEKLIEIITIVISQGYQDQSLEDIDIEGLVSLGYTVSEISAAFSILADKIDVTAQKDFSELTQSGPHSFRVLNEGEKILFSSEAWGVIVQLSSIGLLTSQDIEKIIESAIITGSFDIGRERLAAILNKVLISPSQDMLSTRTTLKGNETVH